MMTNQKQITEVSLDKQAMIWIGGIPFQKRTIADLAQALVDNGADEIIVRFDTMEGFHDQDIKRFSNRIRKIASASGYTICHEWEHPVVDGHIFSNRYQLKISR